MSRILICGPETETAALAALFLEASPGSEVETCDAGARALTAFNRATADLVLVSARLADESWDALAARLRAAAGGQEAGLVVVVWREDAAQLRRIPESIVDDALILPLDAIEATARLRGLAALAQACARANHFERQGALLRLAVEQAPARISVLDSRRAYRAVSASLAALLGREVDEMLGRKPEEMLHASDGAIRQTFEREILAEGLTLPAREEELVDAAGAAHPHLVARAPLRDGAGEIVGLVSCALPAPEGARVGQDGDRLTGLPSRQGLRASLEARLAEARAVGRAVALHRVRIDNLRDLNERFGLAMGDRLLQAIARRLVKTGEGDRRAARLVGRHSGDAFLVVQPNVAEEAQIETLAARLVEAMAEPFQLAGEEIAAQASVTSVVHPLHGASADELFDALDLDPQTLAARAQGLEPPPAPGEATPDDLAALLRVALDHDELRMHYQPRFGLAEGRIVGAEALLRWDRPGAGLVGAGALLETAAEIGELQRLTERIAAQVAKDGKLLEAVEGDLVVTLKVSMGQLADIRAREALTAALAGSGGKLAAELPLAALRALPKEAQALLAACGAAAVDCGYEDPAPTLAAAPRGLARLKLSADSSHAAPEPLGRLVNAAHGRGLRLVGANVERADQLVALREAGVDEAQGYLLQRPLDMSELLSLMRGGAL